MIKKHLNDTPGKVLLTSRFRYADHRFFFGRARLYADRIGLMGFSWRGFHRRTILLRDVVRVSWRTDSERAANVTIYLHQDHPIRLFISGAGLWKHQIDERLGNRLGVTEDLPGVAPSLSAA